MDVKTIQSKGMEADDVIASIAMLFKDRAKITISSFDSDFFQLITEQVHVLRYREYKLHRRVQSAAGSCQWRIYHYFRTDRQ